MRNVIYYKWVYKNYIVSTIYIISTPAGSPLALPGGDYFSRRRAATCSWSGVSFCSWSEKPYIEVCSWSGFCSLQAAPGCSWFAGGQGLPTPESGVCEGLARLTWVENWPMRRITSHIRDVSRMDPVAHVSHQYSSCEKIH